jgi:hypothetical protein
MVFEKTYGFNVTWELVGGSNPTADLNCHLATFVRKYARMNTLLIIYYAGHGVYANGSIQFQP